MRGDGQRFQSVLSDGLVGEMEFTPLLCDGRYLSVLYAGRNADGNGVNLQTYPLTIDLERAAWTAGPSLSGFAFSIPWTGTAFGKSPAPGLEKRAKCGYTGRNGF